MSSVGEKETSEVGGLQGVVQNLGSSLGTALIGSVLIASLSASFLGAVDASDLPDAVKAEVSVSTESAVGIVPVSSVDQIVQEAGLSSAESAQLTSIYGDSQVSSLRASFFDLIIFSLASLLFSKNVPTVVVGGRRTKQEKTVNRRTGGSRSPSSQRTVGHPHSLG